MPKKSRGKRGRRQGQSKAGPDVILSNERHTTLRGQALSAYDAFKNAPKLDDFEPERLRGQLRDLDLERGFQPMSAVQLFMRVLRNVPNISSQDPAHSRRFYQGALGYDLIMDLDWIVTFASPDHPAAQVSVITRDPSGMHPALSIEVDDVDAAHTEMQQQGFEVVYPLQDEPWGVRRFFVRDADGTVVNILMHL